MRILTEKQCIEKNKKHYLTVIKSKISILKKELRSMEAGLRGIRRAKTYLQYTKMVNKAAGEHLIPERSYRQYVRFMKNKLRKK